MAALDQLEGQWASWTPRDGEVDLDACRAFMDELRSVYDDAKDSPELLAHRDAAYDQLLSFWGRVVKDREAVLSLTERDRMLADLSLGRGGKEHIERLCACLGAFQLAVQATPRSLSLSRLRDLSVSIHELLEERTAGGTRPMITDIRSAIRTWLEDNMADVVEAMEPDHEAVMLGEGIADLWPNVEAIQQAVGSVHLLRSRALAVGGVGSLLARAHELRSRELGTNSSGSMKSQLEQQIASALSATDWPEVSVFVGLDPRIEPWLRDLVQMGLNSSVLHSGDGWTTWAPYGQDPSAVDVLIEVLDAKFIQTTWDELKVVSSSYFSHFEDVPNSRKKYLKGQLDYQDTVVDLKLSSYNSAVNSHNWYPTDYSLQAANNAYTYYTQAVDNYNYLVASYNACPDYVSEAVYLPYSYREGQVSFGWELDFRIRVGGASESLHAESIVSDFVRLGTRYADRSENRRIDNPLSIDIGSEASVMHLLSTMDELAGVLDPLLAKVEYDVLTPLDSEEERILGGLLHPWGPGAGAWRNDVSDRWLDGVLDRLATEVPIALPPRRSLSDPADMPPRSGGLQRLADWYGPITVQTVSESNSGTATGTGVLIDGEGLVLTCNHVLHGPNPKVRVIEGPAAGTYDAEVIFTNQSGDVALLRAHGLSTARWAPVRLGGAPVRGEPIMAIGNPAIMGGGSSTGTATEGRVANPSAERFGKQVMLADVTISSGSSGGPLVSIVDGKVIGVVQSVMSEGIGVDDSDVASSGYTCAGASTDMLGELLGLEHD